MNTWSFVLFGIVVVATANTLTARYLLVEVEGIPENKSKGKSNYVYLTIKHRIFLFENQEIQ